MEFQDILYTKEHGIATITLNRPQALNALSPRLSDEWIAAIEDAKADDEVRVLVVTGAGRAFCSGANPRALNATRHHRPEEDTPTSGMPRALADFNKPYIGSINGPAVGGGMDMASLCDIRIASEQARFGMLYVRMGVVPADGGCYFLPRIVGLAKACELIWTGRIIDAEEAFRIGYVNQVVPHEELKAATRELAMQLAKGPAVAIGLDKQLIYRCWSLDLEAALAAHEEAYLIVRDTEDAKEGPRAWVEKREPVFKGK